jgi:hypothetical protein
MLTKTRQLASFDDRVKVELLFQGGIHSGFARFEVRWDRAIRG